MMLMQAEIPCRKREAPDFEIRLDEKLTVYVECTSTNLTQPRDRDVAYKISSAIAKKAKKPYCNRHTALFLDFTNVFYRSAEARNALDTELLGTVIEESARKTSFGAVCSCSMLQIAGRGGYSLGFPKAYRAKDGDPALAAFLDNYFSNLGVEFPGEVECTIPYSI